MKTDINTYADTTHTHARITRANTHARTHARTPTSSSTQMLSNHVDISDSFSDNNKSLLHTDVADVGIIQEVLGTNPRPSQSQLLNAASHSGSIINAHGHANAHSHAYAHAHAHIYIRINAYPFYVVFPSHLRSAPFPTAQLFHRISFLR